MSNDSQRAGEERSYGEFEPPHRLLLGPGPSPVEERVLKAMAAPVIGHMDPVFLRCMDDIQHLLRYVFETDNLVTFPVSGTGSAGMEAAMVNCLEPGDEVVVCVMGVFGERMLDIIERTGAKPIVITAEWGKPIDPNKIEDALRSSNARALALVHTETSTGVRQDLEGLADLVEGKDALLIVDAVASLGGLPVGVDRNGIDVCFSGSQKCISAPPGLAPITFSARALERLRARKTKVQSWYFDATGVERYWGAERTYHHTAPISTNYALREALRIIHEEGLEARWRRHEQNFKAFVAGVEAMGLELLVEPRYRPWSVNAVKVPEGVSDTNVRRRLLEEMNIDIAGGLGQFKGRLWRIGLMGSGSTRENVLLALYALHRALNAEGFRCPQGIDAAESAYAEESHSQSSGVGVDRS